MYFFIKKYNDVKKFYKYFYVVVVYYILEFYFVFIIGLYF